MSRPRPTPWEIGRVLRAEGFVPLIDPNEPKPYLEFRGEDPNRLYIEEWQ